MKKTFRTIALVAVIGLAATSCQKETFNDVIGNSVPVFSGEW